MLLKVPFGINVSKASKPGSSYDSKRSWRVVNWIDSKALFGDTETHNKDIIAQGESYLHRFGPGMILYWFGHAPIERLSDCGSDLTICDHFPMEVMLPTGEFLKMTG